MDVAGIAMSFGSQPPSTMLGTEFGGKDKSRALVLCDIPILASDWTKPDYVI